MASSVADILNAIAPLFNSDPNASTFLELAYSQTSACYYGASYNLAVAYRAAHLWAMSKRSSSEAGALVGKRMGPVSVQFQTSAGGDDSDLALTTFGKQLMGLMKSQATTRVLGGTICRG